MRLMQLAQDKFAAHEEKGVWGQLSEEQAEIVAMKTQLEKATPKQTKNNNPKTKETKKDSSDKKERRDGAWKIIKPKPGEAYTKQVKNKMYHWCKNHKEEGMWVIHHPEDCRNKPRQEEAHANKAEFPTQDGLPSDYEDEEESWLCQAYEYISWVWPLANWILWMPQSIWLVLADIGLFAAASILFSQVITLIILCSTPQDHDAPYVPKKKRPPWNLQHLIQPLIPVRNWIWRQADAFVQGLRVTSRRRQSPVSCRINRNKSKGQRAKGNDE